jgi:hypothetical protein|tara:strand:- start:803 stop:1330 length:528 start_codon:yes stop_codon:yes gene_type:complete
MNNNIYFTEAVGIDALNNTPNNIINMYDVTFHTPPLGCIRTVDNKVIAIYFYVSTNIQEYAIIKFNYIKENMFFDSIYLRKEKDNSFNNKKEYRYDKENNLIASYDFYSESDDLFCTQNKSTSNKKNYTRFKKPQKANKALKELSKTYLTKEITTELIPAFHTSGNDQEVYWLIK